MHFWSYYFSIWTKFKWNCDCSCTCMYCNRKMFTLSLFMTSFMEGPMVVIKTVKQLFSVNTILWKSSVLSRFKLYLWVWFCVKKRYSIFHICVSVIFSRQLVFTVILWISFWSDRDEVRLPHSISSWVYFTCVDNSIYIIVADFFASGRDF